MRESECEREREREYEYEYEYFIDQATGPFQIIQNKKI